MSSEAGQNAPADPAAMAMPETPAAANPDLRRLPLRPDLAAVSLRNQYSAPRYAPGIRRQIMRAAVPLRKAPNPNLGIETEILFGESVTVYDEAEGWAWVQVERDKYVGYIPAEALGPDTSPPTHRVKALGTFVYPIADMKSAPILHLSVNSQLRVIEEGERFARLERGGFIVSRHIAEKGRFERDPVDIAERLIGTPYLWGGRTRLGIDCSGLVQISFEAAGIACPRDSDMQAAEVGEPIAIPETLEGLERGDLIFWPGHVGVMIDGVMMVHANAHHMAVVIETLPEAAHRIAKSASPITAIRRLAKA